MFGVRYSNGFFALFLWTISDLYATVVVQAQSNGSCVCQPGEIEFTFDFALGCDNRTILSGLPGISEAVCVVSTNGTTIFDNVPISVSSITVSELDINLLPVKTTINASTYLSGDTFLYEAFSVSDTDSVRNGTIPTGLQVSLTGLNADNQEIINNVVILFTNDCSIYPVLDTDSTIGWTSLVCTCHPCYVSLEMLFFNIFPPNV